MRVAVVLDLQNKSMFQKIVGVFESTEKAVNAIMTDNDFEFTKEHHMARGREMDRHTGFGSPVLIIRSAADKETGAHKDLYMITLKEIK